MKPLTRAVAVGCLLAGIVLAFATAIKDMKALLHNA